MNSFDALLALPEFGPGATVAVRGGATVRRDGLSTYMDRLTLVSYDGMVILDGTRVAANDSFTPHPTQPNCYAARWPHRYDGSASWCRIWVDGVPLKRRATEAEVEATPGTYVFNDGGPVVAGEPVAIVAHFPAGADPRTSVSLIEITYRDCALSLGNDCTAHGFHGRRFSSHNGAFRLGERPRASRLLAEEGTLHCWVMGDGVIEDVIAVNAADNEYGAGAILGTVYVNAPASGREATLNRVAFLCDRSVYGGAIDTGNVNGSAFYCHGTAGAFDRITMNGATSSGLYSGLTIAANEAVVNDLFLSGGRVAVSGAASLTLRRGLLLNFGSVSDVKVVDAQNVVAITTAGVIGAVFFNVRSARLVDNYVVLDGGVIVAGSTGETLLLLSGNIFDGVIYSFQVDRLAPQSRMENNVYRPGGAEPLYVAIGGSRTPLEEWKTQGFDLSSFVGDPGWQSGRPTPAAPDVRLAAASPALSRIGNTVSQSAIDEYLRRPRTIKDAALYLEYQADRYLVA